MPTPPPTQGPAEGESGNADSAHEYVNITEGESGKADSAE